MNKQTLTGLLIINNYDLLIADNFLQTVEHFVVCLVFCSSFVNQIVIFQQAIFARRSFYFYFIYLFFSSPALLSGGFSHIPEICC